MIKPKPLLFYKSKDGEPTEERVLSGDTKELFTYDISLGTKVEIFLRNPNHNSVCDVSKMFVNDADIEFISQDKIYPLETARCYIEIKPTTEKEVDRLVSLDEYTEDKKINIEGKIEWEQLGISWGGSERLYGW